MKKFLILLLALTLVFVMAACGNNGCTAHTDADNNGKCDSCGADVEKAPCTTHVDENNDKKCDSCGEDMPVSVMSYEEFIAAELNAEVTVETYVQAKQSWWEKDGVGVGTFYTQSEDGAYFIYEMPCSEEEYNALTEGTKIRVTGYKAAWSGEVEIIDATYEIIDGSYVSNPLDVTELLGTDELINYQNFKVAFDDMVVVAANDEGAAFLYGWDGSGSEGGDIYFKASVGGAVYTFVIESYLTNADSDVYKAAQALKVGDLINMEGFLYWYNGAQPHVTSIEVVKIMSYEEFIAAELNAEVTVETYVQAKQSWWEKNGVGVGTFYTQSEGGAYFIYEMPCSEEEYNALTVGTKIRVTGYKAAWSGEVEIIDATYEIIEGSYVSTPLDVTELLGTDELINYQNFKVSFSGMTVVAANDEGAAFLYGWDGSGSEGGDIYFKASIGDTVYTFVIESYLTNADSDVYKAAQALNVGDVIDMEGFLYWYNGAQPHIVSITVK